MREELSQFENKKIQINDHVTALEKEKLHLQAGKLYIYNIHVVCSICNYPSLSLSLSFFLSFLACDKLQSQILQLENYKIEIEGKILLSCTHIHSHTHTLSLSIYLYIYIYVSTDLQSIYLPIYLSIYQSIN